LKRRHFLHHGLLLGTGLLAKGMLPAWAQSARREVVLPGMLAGREFALTVDRAKSHVAGKAASHITLNGQFPAPLLRWREGDDVTLRVINRLDETTSIHWHGLLLPYQMDGVPGVSFPGIPAESEFTYRFPVKQAGTYWYHSHSGLQEQIGHYGPIIIDAADMDPVDYDREHVVMLSDWTFENPHRVFSKLKKMSDNYNFQQRTLREFFNDIDKRGFDAAWEDRLVWGDMRMSPTDLSDVTSSTYSYLVNGHSPEENWTALFQPREKIRLRFINASAMSIFNVRIPGLPMTVVSSDGLNVKPVTTDEFQIGTAETFDVIVQPDSDQTFTIMCETNDRSGYAAATLATKEGVRAPIPPRRPRPTLTMKDMGMGGMDHSVIEEPSKDHATMNHSSMNHTVMEQPATRATSTDHAAMNLVAMDEVAKQVHNHPMGPGVVNVAMNPVNRLHERPLGLENEPHRVLVYTDLESLEPNPDLRAPARELELHLTSNMERYMWSFDGIKFSEVSEPIMFHQGERLRLTLVNDTMMPHPIHLHGMFFEVVTGSETHKPRKHTIVIKPGEKMSVDITADVAGDWAFHCHLLYHMHAGMMRMVRVQEQLS
jgi:CopA family copper-resistance protein